MNDRIDLGDGAELRAAVLADLDEVHALKEANLDHLRPWMPWADQDRDGTEAYLRESAAERAAGRAWSYVIVQDGAIVGTAGVHHVDLRNGSLMLGYWLDAGAQGRGLVTRSVRALCAEAFALGFHRAELRADPANARSRAVGERLGFTYEGTARGAERFGDGYRDLVVYALLADDPRQ